MKFYHKIVFTFLLSSLFLFTHAQNSKAFDKKWELAKGHFSDENYDMALMLFTNLTSENASNPYVEYANYYTALCLFKLNQLRESRAYLLQLKNKYPNWENYQDAQYLHANIEFINENYLKAIDLLQSCDVKGVKDMKLHYLSKIPSIHLLTNLHQTYPEDAEVATIYCYRLVEKSFLLPAEKEEILSLIDTYQIKDHNLKKKVNSFSDKALKDTYNIAVIYPFYLENIEKYKTPRKNQFVIDHYWGIKQALDSLSKKGTHIKLHSYDSQNDTNEVKKILQQEELKQMDVILGSVYKNNMKYISKFANDNNIICFNPMSNYSYTIQDSGFVYMHNPSYETIGKNVAEFVIDSFANKRILYISFASYKDTTIGNAFISRLAEDSMEVSNKIVIPKGTDVLTALSKVPRESIDVVFAPSSNTSVGTNLISWLIMREVDIPVIGNAKWLDSREYNLIRANEKTSYFFNENYVNNAMDSTYSFKKKYFETYNVPPSIAAYKGYELGLFIGENLLKNGKHFNLELKNSPPQKGYYTPIHDYRNSYCNNYVPILKLKDYQLTLVNYTNTIEDITDESNKQ